MQKFPSLCQCTTELVAKTSYERMAHSWNTTWYGRMGCARVWKHNVRYWENLACQPWARVPSLDEHCRLKAKSTATGRELIWNSTYRIIILDLYFTSAYAFPESTISLGLVTSDAYFSKIHVKFSQSSHLPQKAYNRLLKLCPVRSVFSCQFFSRISKNPTWDA